VDQELIVKNLRENTALCEFLEGLGAAAKVELRTVANALKEEYLWPEAHDLRPMLLRASMERLIAEVAGKTKGVHAHPRPNEARNCYHREVASGRFVLTASQVKSPGEMVREAVYRITLASESQLLLPGFETTPNATASYYAILLYGQSGTGSPFLHLAIPTRDYLTYLVNIDLFEFFAIDYRDEEGAPVAPIHDEVVPRLKPLKKGRKLTLMESE